MRIAVFLLLLSTSTSTSATASLEDIVGVLAAGRTVDGPGALLREMARDEVFADAVLVRASREHVALTDSLVQLLRMTEPEARTAIDSLYVVDDHSAPPGERPPSWTDLRWQGVRLFLQIALDPEVGRDVRARSALRRSMQQVDSWRRSEVAGLIALVEQWWADRGDDPTLTHDSDRILDLAPYLTGLQLPADDPDAWTAPWMLAALDADPVLRVRVLRELDPDRHAHLFAELADVLRMLPEDLAEAGIPERRWVPARGRMVGHNAGDLWELAVETIDRCLGESMSGNDDRARRIAALARFEQAKWEARYWRDPRDAPTLDRFLDGPSGPEETAAAWARSIYLQRSASDLILSRLEGRHRATVGELVHLITLPRDEAHRAGFVMAYRSPSFDRPGETDLIGIDWDRARTFLRSMLERLTGAREPAGVGELDPGAQASFWLDWWAAHRDEPQWTRPGAPTPSTPEPKLRLETRRGRVDR